MIPFKVFDRQKKITWVILNFHASESGGQYLAAREDDSEHDGDLVLIPAQDMTRFRMVGFVEDVE